LRRAIVILAFMIDGEFAALQAPTFDSLSFDRVALFNNTCNLTEACGSRRYIVQVLVETHVDVALYAGLVTCSAERSPVLGRVRHEVEPASKSVT